MKHFKRFVFISMIIAYSSWKSKIQYLRILAYFLKSMKMDLQYRNIQLQKSMFINALNTWLGLL